MVPPHKKAILENAADLLEELGHAGAEPLRELIRDKRLESLATFLLYGGAMALTRSDTGGACLEAVYGEFTRRADIAGQSLQANGIDALAGLGDQVVTALEAQVGLPLCERGETPLVECLAILAATFARICPKCGSANWPSFDPVAEMMVCNTCGLRMRLPPGEA